MKNPFIQILFGVFGATLAAGIQWVLWPWIGHSRFILFYPAVIIISLIGGVKAGLSATVAGTMAALYLFFTPPFPIHFDGPQKWSAILIFIVSGIMISVIGEILQRRTQALAATEEQKKANDRFRLIFDSSPNAFMMVDEKGTIKLVNKQTTTLFGYTPEELLGHNVEILIPERFRPKHVDHRNAFMSAPSARPMGAGRDLFGRRKNGSEIPVEIALTPVKTETGILILCTLTDITERKRTQDERSQLLMQEHDARLTLERARWKDELFSEAGRILAGSIEYEATLKNVAGVMVPKLADWCMVGLQKEDGDTRLLTVISDQSKSDLARSLELCTPDMSAPEGIPKAIRTSQSLLYPEVLDDQLWPDPGQWTPVGTTDPEHLRTIRELGLKSYMVVPLVIRDKTIGAIMIASSQKNRRYDACHLEVANELVRRCSIAIERASLYRDAQVAIRLRDDFLSIAAHELKTPLTSLGMQIQLINRMAAQGSLAELSKEKASALLKISQQQIDRFSTLINDLLDASRITAGRLTLHIEQVDLSELLREVVRKFELELAKASCPVNVHAPAHIIGAWDRVRVEQIIVNLLSNAMKYGAGKPIEITAQIEEERVKIIVQDHGVGVPREDQKRIFERFERAVSARSFGGLGLGLFIVRQIIETHHGSIRVESEPSRGATFIVELPITPNRKAHGPHVNRGTARA